jgi:hypothetical protein
VRPDNVSASAVTPPRRVLPWVPGAELALPFGGTLRLPVTVLRRLHAGLSARSYLLAFRRIPLGVDLCHHAALTQPQARLARLRVSVCFRFG